MESLDFVLAAYIDINLLLAGTVLLWLVCRKLWPRVKIGKSFTSQFLLLKLMVLTVLILPLALAFGTQLTGPSQPIPTTLSDLVLSQYLQGNLQISPDWLEYVLSLRQNFTSKLATPNHPLVYALVVGILLTAAAMLLRSALMAWKLRRILKSSHQWRSFGNLNLVLSDTIHIPFSTRSLTTKFVVIPSALITRPDDLKVALAHELQHLRDSDVDWEFGITLLTPLFFWNPAFHYFRRQLEELRELSCDQKVLARGRLTIEQYCGCLLRVCADRFHRPKLFQLRLPEVALAETRMGFIGNRPARLLANRLLHASNLGESAPSRTKIVLAAGLLFALVCSLSFAIQQPHGWSQNRLMLSTIINLERLETRNKIGLGSYRNY